MPIRGAVGVLGQPGWAEVDERGAVHAPDGSWHLHWFVGADRWRDPRSEVAVRHHARSGTPVFETALRVEGGDVRQRVYGVAERDGLLMVEVENDSPAPVAVAFHMSGRHSRPILSARPPASVVGPVGPDAPPAEAYRFPLPHRGVLRVALPLGTRTASWPERAPSAEQVVAGWRAALAHGERLDATGLWPDQYSLARSRLLLADEDEPAAMLIALGVRVHFETLSIDRDTAYSVGTAAQLVAERSRDAMSVTDRAALVDALHLLVAAGDRRAAADVDRVLADATRCDSSSSNERAADLVANVRGMIVREAGEGRALQLLRSPAAEWRRENFAAHEIPTRFGRLSFAVRWHGTRPALLWEFQRTDDDPVSLSAPLLDPDWSTTQARGEALLAVSPT